MRQITIQVGWPGGIAWWRPFLDSAPRGLGQLSYLRHIKMQGACREAIWTETKTCSIQDGQGIDYQANPANSSRVLSFRYVNFFKELYIWCLLEVRGARTMRVQCYSETKVVRGPPWPAIAPRWCSPQQSHLLRWLSRSQWTRQITVPLRFLNQLISATFNILALSLNFAEKIAGCARTTCLWSCLGGLGSSILALRHAKRNMTSRRIYTTCLPWQIRLDCFVSKPLTWAWSKRQTVLYSLYNIDTTQYLPAAVMLKWIEHDLHESPHNSQ